MRLFLAILLTLSAHAQDWNFSSPSDTNGCVVSPGAFSEGWIDTLYGMGTNQGLWDLGQLGYIAVSPTLPTNLLASVSVTVVAWCDESLYPAPQVLLEGGTLIESSRTYNTGRLGAWQTFSSTWTVVADGKTILLVTQTNPQKSTVIDRIEVSYGIPRPTPADDGKKPKKPKKQRNLP